MAPKRCSMVVAALFWIASATAWAQPSRPAAESEAAEAESAPPAEQPPAAASEPPGGSEETEPPEAGPLPGADETAPPKVANEPPAAQYGVGLDYQFLIVPQFFLKAFLRAAKSDDHNLYRHGFGAHFIRRKGNLDMIVRVMFGFMMSEDDDGNWLGRGHGFDEVDYTEFHDLNFLWADISFIYNWEVARNLYVGLGGGIGLGWVMGDIYTTESYTNGTVGNPCTSSNFDDCSQCHPAGVTGCTPDGCPRSELKGHPNREKEKVPPVLPALNGVFSLRYDIWRHTSVRLNTGIFLPGFWMTNVTVEWMF